MRKSKGFRKYQDFQQKKHRTFFSKDLRKKTVKYELNLKHRNEGFQNVRTHLNAK